MNHQFKYKKLLYRDITDFVSNATVICEEAEQVVFDGGHILHVILRAKNIRWQDTGLKYTSCVISNFRSASAVFDGYPENVTTTDNTHKCRLAISRKKGSFSKERCQ